MSAGDAPLPHRVDGPRTASGPCAPRADAGDFARGFRAGVSACLALVPAGGVWDDLRRSMGLAFALNVAEPFRPATDFVPPQERVRLYAVGGGDGPANHGAGDGLLLEPGKTYTVTVGGSSGAKVDPVELGLDPWLHVDPQEMGVVVPRESPVVAEIAAIRRELDL